MGGAVVKFMLLLFCGAVDNHINRPSAKTRRRERRDGIRGAGAALGWAVLVGVGCAAVVAWAEGRR